ncbi:MAG: DNA-binding domain-containing protein [Planctomycetota bacterium]
MNNYVDIQEAARRLNKSPRQVRRMCHGGNHSNGLAISDAAWRYFLELYLTPQGRSVAECFLMVAHRNTAEGCNWKIPNVRTLQRYVKRIIPWPVRVALREGRRAYIAKCAPSTRARQ